MRCTKCKKEFGDGDSCYEVRFGGIYAEAFQPESDVGHYCTMCFPGSDILPGE